MILTYHKIYPEAKTIWWVTPDSFYCQMVDLRCKKVVYLDDYDPSDEDQCVITFDGVYQNLWKYAIPILRHFGYVFELFVIGQSIGKTNAFDAIEPSTEFADHETLSKMIQAGGRLQWHSWSHTRLSGEPPGTMQRELTVPNDLRDMCPQGFKWYAYPYGERESLYRSEVEARFTGAVATDDGNDNDRCDLKRLTVDNDTRLSKSRVSLIIPCYNYGHLVAESIESALSQTYPADEILFIDDASTDNSVEVARRYGPRIRVEANQKNLGVVENFRKAVGLTHGDYICFLGADNRFRSDYIEQTKTILDKEPETGVVYTDFVLFDARAAVVAAEMKASPHPTIPNLFYKRFPADPKQDIRKLNYIHGSSMYRRAAYEQAGGYRTGAMPEDASLFARMLDLGWKARLVDDFLLEYRQHAKDQLNIGKTLELENAYLRGQVRDLSSQVQDLTSQLRNITGSRSWRLLMWLQRLQARLLPYGSWRRRMTKKLLALLLAALSAIRDIRQAERDRSLIIDSGLFDSDWYLVHNPDAAAKELDPARHYLFFGGFEGRDPGPGFSSQWYLNRYPDVQATKMNPLLHYLRFGKMEGRLPEPPQGTSDLN